MVAAIALPRVLRMGGGASRDIVDVLRQFDLARPLVVTDRFLVDSGSAATLLTLLEHGGVSARVFADTVSDPTVSSIMAGIKFLADADHDCVIGFGGGSPIDTAKAIAVMGVLGGDPSDYKAPRLQDAPGLPIFAIPTTAGTGSEATRFTVVSDERTNEKMLCAGMAYLPTAALVDFELTLTKPPRLTADTAVDALTHAIEAYVSRRANPFSDEMALAAMREIAPNIRRVFRDGRDRTGREALMRGATLAGIAFSNASIALVHGMSRPIGAHFHIPHGLSNAMLLPTVTQWSAPAAIERYAACAHAMGLSKAGEGNQASVARLIDELHLLNADLQVPSPRNAGIDPRRWQHLLPAMAQQALASGSPAHNPRQADATEIIALYEQAWECRS